MSKKLRLVSEGLNEKEYFFTKTSKVLVVSGSEKAKII